MEQFNKGTDHALVSQRFSLIKRLGPEPHRRRLRECFPPPGLSPPPE